MATKVLTQNITLRHHAIYVCSRLLAYGLPLLYFLVTSSFYLKTYDSAQVKITFTQMGASTLLFIWLLKVLLEGRLPFRKMDFVFVAPFIAYLCSGLMSFIHGPFKAWPLEEALRRFFYIIMALITIAEFRSEERMARLWRWLLAAAVLSTVYGLVQYIDTRFFGTSRTGIDPFIWRQAFSHRVFSTFGNPNFYGNFLVIVTPLIMASILRVKGSLVRPFVVVLITGALIFCVDTLTRGSFIGYDPSYEIVLYAAITLLLFTLVGACVWKTAKSGALSLFLILFAILFLNLYSTETKGAWLGYMSAVSITLFLIFEYFLHTEEKLVGTKKYLLFVGVLIALFSVAFSHMTKEFVVPYLKGEVAQVGFSILWIPVAVAGVITVLSMIWVLRPPWNLKKLIYGFIFLFIVVVGGQVLSFAKFRLRSVSFRLFTWIATWEMVRSSPIFGNGVGSFKVIYPAFRRPQIIALEGKSNTETDHAEDEYIEIWQDEGIIGFGIFLWMALTAIVCGLKQLRWYSKIRPPPEQRKKSKWSVIEGDPRSYEVLGILGAYAGALIHWSVDVSIRFVSSGIFSGLLPGLLVAYARNHANPVRVEARMPYERWIRVGLAGIWTAIMLYLGMELVPQGFIKAGDTTTGQIVFFALLAGGLLWAILELLEIGLVKGDEDSKAFLKQYDVPPMNLAWLRMAGIVLLVLFLAKSLRAFGNFFQADVHHNLAIFFSKQSIWRKSPEFQSKIQRLPVDIKEKYQEYGGALEHYQQVIRNNPGFPMARYFTGNVYNDWGSQIMNRGIQAKRAGNMKEALRLKQNALDKWQQAEDSYSGTKSLAPNYVQVHHQMGLLNTKRAQHAREYGEIDQMNKYYDAALENFYKYRMLDPVFPPNYHRIVEILIQRNKFDEAVTLYKEAMYYNTVVVNQIYKENFNDRIADIGVNLGKVLFTQATRMSKTPFDPRLPQIDEAITYFQKAVDADPKNVEALKGLGRLLGMSGKQQEAQKYLGQAFKLAPNDPELRTTPPPKPQ